MSKDGKRSEDEQSDDDDMEGGYMIGEDVYVPPPPSKPLFCGEETGKRLIITHITNINFKSYANTTVLGPFHKVRYIFMLLKVKLPHHHHHLNSHSRPLLVQTDLENPMSLTPCSLSLVIERQNCGSRN